MTPTHDNMRLDSSQYQRSLGLILENSGVGAPVRRLPFREQFLRDDGSDGLHGGITSASIDNVGASAVVTP